MLREMVVLFIGLGTQVKSRSEARENELNFGHVEPWHSPCS